MSKHPHNDSDRPVSDLPGLSPMQHDLDSIDDETPLAKYGQVETDLAGQNAPFPLQCHLGPHKDTACFGTQEEFERHHIKDHANRCVTCSKNFPTIHYLELHIEENHDALREVQAERGEKTYRCLVEDCDRKCSNAQKRRLHLIDKHTFPRNYNFQIVDEGVDKTSSMLRESRKRRVSTACNRYQPRRNYPLTVGSELQRELERPIKLHSGHENTGCKTTNCTSPKTYVSTLAQGDEAKDPQANLNGLTHSMSALRFVPPSLLGHPVRKGEGPAIMEFGGEKKGAFDR